MLLPVFPTFDALSRYGFDGAAKKEKEKADTLEFFWGKSTAAGPRSHIPRIVQGVKWRVRLRTDSWDHGLSFEISCNAERNSTQWSARPGYSIELYSSPDMLHLIARETGTFGDLSSSRKCVSVYFESCPSYSSSSDEHESDSSSTYFNVRRHDCVVAYNRCSDLSEVTFCRCVLHNISSKGLKLSESIDFARWKLTDEITSHDRVLLVGGVKFYVQSQVLSLWSPYFDKLFNSNFSEGQQREIELKDIESEDFEHLLQHIYPQEEQPEIDECNVHVLMELSDRFAMGRVFRRCRSFLLDKDSNPLDMFLLLQLADRYNLVDVKEHLLNRLVMLPSLNDHIDQYQKHYNMLSLTTRRDVLNVFRRRKEANKRNPDSDSISLADVPSQMEDPWKLSDQTTPHDKVLLVAGVKFYIQSQMLSLWSPYFYELFNSKLPEGQTQATEIELKDIESEAFDQLLQYIYPREKQQEITDSSVSPLMDLSHRFAIRRVFERCREFLKRRTSLNVFETMQLAGRFNLLDVQESALDRLLEVPSLHKYIADHQTHFDAFSVAAQHDVLNVFRLRNKVKRRKLDAPYSDKTYYSSDSDT